MSRDTPTPLLKAHHLVFVFSDLQLDSHACAILTFSSPCPCVHNVVYVFCACPLLIVPPRCGKFHILVLEDTKYVKTCASASAPLFTTSQHLVTSTSSPKGDGGWSPCDNKAWHHCHLHRYRRYLVNVIEGWGLPRYQPHPCLWVTMRVGERGVENNERDEKWERGRQYMPLHRVYIEFRVRVRVK
mgnify:CR=1 FL=1